MDEEGMELTEVRDEFLYSQKNAEDTIARIVFDMRPTKIRVRYLPHTARDGERPDIAYRCDFVCTYRKSMTVESLYCTPATIQIMMPDSIFNTLLSFKNKSLDELSIYGGSNITLSGELLSKVLSENENIQRMELHGINFTDTDTQEICKGLSVNQTLRALKIHNDNLTEASYRSFFKAILRNPYFFFGTF